LDNVSIIIINISIDFFILLIKNIHSYWVIGNEGGFVKKKKGNEGSVNSKVV